MCWGCYRECLRIASIVLPTDQNNYVFGPIPFWIGCASVTAALLPALNCLQRGQVGISLLYFLLLGFRLQLSARTSWGSFGAGLIFALPIVIKATPLLPVVFVLYQQAVAAWYSQRWRIDFVHCGANFAGLICGLFVFLFLFPAAVVGWRTNLHHLGTWWRTVATHEENALTEHFAQDNTTEHNQSLTNALHHFVGWAVGSGGASQLASPAIVERSWVDDSSIFRNVLLLLRGFLGGLLLLVGYGVARSQDRLGQTAAFGLAGILTLLICQIARAHYFMVWFPAIMFVCSRLMQDRHLKWAAVFAGVPVILVVTHYAFLHAAGSVGVLGIGTAMWYTAACFAILLLTNSELCRICTTNS